MSEVRILRRVNRREYKSESVLEKTAEKEKDTKEMGNINTPDRVQIGKGGANVEIPRTPCPRGTCASSLEQGQ
jgi:hypothetical protein